MDEYEYKQKSKIIIKNYISSELQEKYIELLQKIHKNDLEIKIDKIKQLLLNNNKINNKNDVDNIIKKHFSMIYNEYINRS
jgi:hypothetical protein